MRTELRATDERRSYLPSRAFTIVELLVTLGIMAALAAMTVFAMGPLQDRSAVNGGAALVQTWLNTARQRAIRDKVPSGLRFLAGSSLPSQSASPNPLYVTRMVYLEGGTELFGTLYGGPGGSGGTTFVLTTAIPSTLYQPLSSANNDTIVINNGLPRAITGGAGTSLAISSAWPYAIPQTAPEPYRILRGPLAISGNGVGSDSENILTMPRGSCVNFDPKTTLSTLYPGGIDLGNYNVSQNANLNYVPKSYFDNIKGLDIMFAPDGTVMAPATNNPILLWICSSAAVNPQISGPGYTSGIPMIEAMRGNPGLVAVYPRTGQVVGYTVEFDQVNVSGTMKANAMKDVQ